MSLQPPAGRPTVPPAEADLSARVTDVDDELLVQTADTFAMLASPARLYVLYLLSQGEQDVTTLAETLGGTVAMVSQHLAKLRLAGLVSARRDGKRQLYSVDDPHVVALVHQGLDHHEQLRREAGRPRRR